MIKRAFELLRRHWVVAVLLIVCVGLAALVGVSARSVNAAAYAGLFLGIAFGMFIAWYTSREERRAERKKKR